MGTERYAGYDYIMRYVAERKSGRKVYNVAQKKEGQKNIGTKNNWRGEISRHKYNDKVYSEECSAEKKGAEKYRREKQLERRLVGINIMIKEKWGQINIQDRAK